MESDLGTKSLVNQGTRLGGAVHRLRKKKGLVGRRYIGEGITAHQMVKDEEKQLHGIKQRTTLGVRPVN